MDMSDVPPMTEDEEVETSVLFGRDTIPAAARTRRISMISITAPPNAALYVDVLSACTRGYFPFAILGLQSMVLKNALNDRIK